jgi:beta-lactamase superfamily II metal-dependent hydrolase
MFRIEMLPAHHGDCLLVSYGDKTDPQRILIDGGTGASFPALRRRLEQLPQGKRHFELLIVTHIDDDHIGGVLKLLQASQELGITFGDVWFNGWKHLIPEAAAPKLRGWLSAKQGEDLSALLVRLNLSWNEAFEKQAVVVPDSGPLPTRKVGTLKLTLLSPTVERLEKLSAKWTDDLMSQGIIPGEAAAQAEAERRWLGGGIDLAKVDLKTFSSDKAHPNGSSIAVLAEHDGRSCLLTGDAFAPVLAKTIPRLPAFDKQAGKLKVDAIKLPHHASRANVSPDLIGLLSCSRYLISTNGDVFEHPDIEAVGRVITLGGPSPELFFNYRSDTTKVWDNDALRSKHGYRTHYPADPAAGITIDL